MSKKYILPILAAMTVTTASAQVGAPYIHDPSTLAECDGKYYTFGTGGGGLISDDGGWTWHGGAERPGGGAAPDVLKIGDRYLVAYSATGGGLGGGHYGKILTMWNKTLDPKSPDFKYSVAKEVAASDGVEDCDAIDAGLLYIKEQNKLYVSYGTYFGNIRIIELDPETAGRKSGAKPVDVAIDCEASDLLYVDGWYYLLGTHGTCCDGLNSTYNIVVGRSKDIYGPYLDNTGRDMKQGGGKMVVNTYGKAVGAGHFGRFVVDDGVEVMSLHFEADFERSGRSVLSILPIVWKDGWPKAGKKMSEGVYSIQSERRGYALELATDFVRIQQDRQAWWNAKPDDPVKVLPTQQLADVQNTWPKGTAPARLSDYMLRPNQYWKIEPAEGKGGYPGNPYFKITINGTTRALAAGNGMDVVVADNFTGDDTQLWRIEQCTDGTYRIMPKRIPGQSSDNTKFVLYSIADSTPILKEWDSKDDNAKWNFVDKEK